MSESSSSTPTKEAMKAASSMFSEDAERIYVNGLGWSERSEVAELIDRETNLPALLESHKQLQEALGRMLRTVSYSDYETLRLVEADAVERVSVALAKSKEITDGK